MLIIDPRKPSARPGPPGTGPIRLDRAAAEAGGAPTTLYRLFASKDDLVAAYVQRADSGYRE